MKPRSAFVTLVLGSVFSVAACTKPVQKTTLKIDGAGSGRVFEGLGALSAGASSRLLIDYPEPQRSQILDYLFKPNYGACLQHLKVEVGGDTNSTDGSEPSHMHSRTDENYDRGYEWWLVKEAKARNPKIMLDALPWGAPGWIGNRKYFSPDMANYIARFLRGAKQHHGLEFDYVGIWNEMGFDVDYIKLLHKTLLANHLTTKIVAADDVDKWGIVDAMEKDPELKAAVAAVGVHYPGYAEYENSGFKKGPPTYVSTPLARVCGKPIWASEDGPWRGDWRGAEELAKMYNRNYLVGRMTKTEIWSPVSSYYDNLPLPGSGLMKANTPWSGHYEVQPTIWATAHTTQFAQPGWQYIDRACGYLNGNGSYVTLKAPSSQDYSVIVETVEALAPQDVAFQTVGGLSSGTIHVWRTNRSNSFEKLSDITPQSGTFAATLDPDSIYSFTTTAGQTKGAASIPPDFAFPFPYTGNFDAVAMGGTPKYFSDQAGAFEVTACLGRKGKCLRQLVTRPTIAWGGSVHDPFTYLGSPDWSDYKVSTDALIEDPGNVALVGRIDSADWGADRDSRWYSGYILSVQQDGAWELNSKTFKTPLAKLASGKAAMSLKTWHHLTLAFKGTNVEASIDGKSVASVTDQCHKKGMAGIGTGWNKAQFANLTIE